MAATTTTFAAALGRRVRRARLYARKSQRAVGEEAGISQSTVSRMELGRGGTIPLATWERVCEAVGLDLSAVVHAPFKEETYAIHVRCHRLVADVAAVGGWSGWTVGNVDDPDRTETILERPHRGETAVIRVWDVVGDVQAALDDLEQRLDDERNRRGADQRVGGAIVATPRGETRRRLTESGPIINRGLTPYGDEWLMALQRSRVPMPDGIGLIWTDAEIVRLRPLVPYVDFRRRQRCVERKMRM